MGPRLYAERSKGLAEQDRRLSCSKRAETQCRESGFALGIQSTSSKCEDKEQENITGELRELRAMAPSGVPKARTCSVMRIGPMQLSHYSDCTPLASGARMIVAGDPIASDGIIIDYPNNTQATANIVNCSADTMEISLNGQCWHLKLQTPQLGS